MTDDVERGSLLEAVIADVARPYNEMHSRRGRKPDVHFNNALARQDIRDMDGLELLEVISAALSANTSKGDR